MGFNIGKGKKGLTVIFEFDGLDNDKQKAASEGIQSLVRDIVSKQPGFMAAGLHLSTDGQKIWNYFQWENKEVFDAFRANEEAQSKIRPVISPYGPKPRPYDIVFSTGQATIDQDQSLLTVIFEFDIKPEQKDALCRGIQGLVENIVSRQPGFISANLHVSKDGEKVLNYLQWQNKEVFDAFRNNESAQSQIKPVIGPYGPKPRVYNVALSVNK